jgi:hypothetical protein
MYYISMRVRLFYAYNEEILQRGLRARDPIKGHRLQWRHPPIGEDVTRRRQPGTTILLCYCLLIIFSYYLTVF